MPLGAHHGIFLYLAAQMSTPLMIDGQHSVHELVTSSSRVVFKLSQQEKAFRDIFIITQKVVKCNGTIPDLA